MEIMSDTGKPTLPHSMDIISLETEPSGMIMGFTKSLDALMMLLMLPDIDLEQRKSRTFWYEKFEINV